MLLHKAISLVKDDPVSATLVTLTFVDTPTSSPTMQRRAHKVIEGSDNAKVSFHPITFYAHITLWLKHEK